MLYLKSKEKTCAFTGHRTDKLYGSDLSNTKYQMLAKLLRKQIITLIEVNNVDTFISGGATGFDTISFFTVESLKNKYSYINNILAIPFEEQSSKWNNCDKSRYERMLGKANQVIYVDKLDLYNKSKNKKYTYSYKYQKRNEFMVDVSSYIIACFDGSKSGTLNCLNYAKEKNNKIYLINPKAIQ
ncbi:TPA: DUF1273 family protein [Clostridioides difficile]|nr:SLOG family protein [Clostridioides difficile]PBG30564.1 hypothetical protein BGU81_02870 [Clostridioides difficile]HBF3307630.1 DUF1273 family protein [Clostridioides difficile]